MSLKLTPFSNNFSAIFFTPTFEWAIIQHGSLWDTHIAAAAAIVVVFPVPGGPAQSHQRQREWPTVEEGVTTMSNNQRILWGGGEHRTNNFFL
jgi:hypothetical protein